jgi:hypothetical protein
MVNNNNDDEGRQEYRLESGEVVYIELESPDAEGLGGKFLISRCVDISANGFQVIADEPLQIGAIHQVCIQLDRPRCSKYMVAEVIWSRLYKGEYDEYTIGLRLYESQDTDIIKWKEVIAERCAL